MCAPSQGTMLPYGLKVPSPYFPFGQTGALPQAHLSALDFQRSQLNDYNVRIQFGLRNYQNSLGLSPFHAYITDPYTQAYFYKHDPRARFVQEEPKPSHSYIGLIGMAILNAKDKKLVLSDIYQWILDNYPYFRTRGPGWRNSIRHNLSLNDCFIKAGRSANGKGHYWAVHPANVEDFERGDFRRRRAQRKVRRHMGLSVPDDEDSPSPSPTQPWPHHDIIQECSDRGKIELITSSGEHSLNPVSTKPYSEHLILSHPTPKYGHVQFQPKKQSRKRLFDMASLLAPDDEEVEINSGQEMHNGSNQEIHVSGFNFHPVHDLKVRDNKDMSLSSDNIESNESNCNEDVIVDMNSSSVSSGMEHEDDSEDDGEHDEIHVTSGDDSPAHGRHKMFNASEVGSASYIYENVDNNKYNTEDKKYTDDQSSKRFSSLYRKEPKVDNVLDLSSSTPPEYEKRLSMFYSKRYDNKLVGMNSVERDCHGRQHRTRSTSHGLVENKDSFENGNIYEGYKSMANSCLITKSIANEDCEQNIQNDSDDIVSSLSYSGRPEPQEQLSFMTRGDPDHIKDPANTLRFFSPDLQEFRRQHIQNHGEELNSGAAESGVVESGRRILADKREHTSKVEVSDSIRVSDDQKVWTDLAKSSLSRDRLSAFSSLHTRNKCMYSPVQRTFNLGIHRLMQTMPVRAGVAAPLIPVSATSSSTTASLIKRLNSGVDKNRHKITSDICSSSPCKDIVKN